MDYSNLNNKSEEELISFEDSLKKELGWDEEKFFFYLGTWLMYYELENLFEGDAWWNNGGNSNTLPFNCVCRSDFACSFGLASCVEGKSDCMKKKGCGFFGSLDCNGRCSNIDP